MAAQNSILVTGGAGFLGSHVTRSLLEDPRFDGLQIVVLDDLSGGFVENIPRSGRVRFVKGSVTDHEFIEGLFEKERTHGTGSTDSGYRQYGLRQT